MAYQLSALPAYAIMLLENIANGILWKDNYYYTPLYKYLSWICEMAQRCLLLTLIA